LADTTCYGKAVQLLAARSHFRAELAAKLSRRGYPQEEVEAALDRLAREGFLDDTRTAREFVAHRQESRGEGRRRLAAELVRRGAPAEAVTAALSDLTPEDDLEAAKEAASRWARGKSRPDAAALARHLERKGFSRRAIVAVLSERPGGGELEAWEEDPGG